jgi:hypothetical protein
MSKNLKDSFNKKMDIKSSKDFDSLFFKKLEKEKSKSNIFSQYFTWIISGCATISIIFLAVNNFHTTRHSFNHQEYIDSVIEMQSSIDENVSSDIPAEGLDLTTSQSDEI